MGRQTGCIYKSKNGERWLARWREDVIEDGQVKRKMRFRDLAPVCDTYRTEKDVQPLLDEILQPINAGKVKPESTLTVAEYGENYWLPWVRENCKPSTIYGYEYAWKSYLEPRLQKVTLRDFRTVDAANILVNLHRSKGHGRTMLKHCKSILSGIFTLARNQGVLDAPNPIQGTMLPKKGRGFQRDPCGNPRRSYGNPRCDQDHQSQGPGNHASTSAQVARGRRTNVLRWLAAWRGKRGILGRF